MNNTIKDFDYTLPPERIAQQPLTKRHEARLLEVNAGSVNDYHVPDIATLLQPGDLLILNNTKVIPARLHGKRGEVSIEITLHKPDEQDGTLWYGFAKPAKRIKPGQTIQFSPDFSAILIEKKDGGECLFRFNKKDEALHHALDQYGLMPLPPYIKRSDIEQDKYDRERYQTVFAKEEGAVAAPTAGLHFTPELLQALERKNIAHAFVTLHVGAGTFLPVKVDNIADHKMHSEVIELSQTTINAIHKTKANGGRVVAVGTTSVRVLESVAAANKGQLLPYQGNTDIFIRPGFEFKIIDLLFTNFHLPCSTLFMLVSAFAGLDNMKAAYDYAISHNYRFLSYGDACLLHKAK